MRRGEIWWADVPPPIGRRPVLLLSRDEAIRMRAQVTVAELTATIHRIPAEVSLGPEDGVPRRCVVNLDTLTTIPKAYLISRICELRADKMNQVHQAVRFALDLP